MAAYSQRHYGQREWRLRDPRVIVQHMAQTPTAAAVFNTFAPDNPDVELGELPNVCSHYVVSRAGKIFRLVNLRTRCRHTVGLNWTAIGIEHAGYGDRDLLGNRRQLRASLRLTQYLRCRFGIGVRDVIGHAESLSSPYHYERVRSLRTQTHGDMSHGSMRTYRKQLRGLGHAGGIAAAARLAAMGETIEEGFKEGDEVWVQDADGNRHPGVFVGYNEAASWFGGGPSAYVVRPEAHQAEIVSIFGGEG